MNYVLTLSRTLPFPPERVFDFVVDMRNDPRWAPMVRSVTQLEGDGPGAGALYEVEQAVAPGEYIPVRIRVEVAERPLRIVWTCDDRIMRYRSEMALEPVPGGTRVTQTNRNELKRSRMPAWLLALIARITIGRQFRRLARVLATGG